MLRPSVLCAALALVSSTPAYADPAPPPPAATLEYGGAPIPANGGLIIRGVLGLSVSENTVRVLAPDGTAVAGKLTLFGSVTTWTPARPLTAGQTYDVTLLPTFGVDASHPENHYAIMVTPPRAPARPAMTSMLSVTPRESETGLACCSDANGAGRGCFATQTSRVIAMQIALNTTTPTPELAQYLFKLGIRPLNQDGAYEPFDGLVLLYYLGMPSPDYCFDLEAMDIGSGQVFDYADLMPRCSSPGDVGAFGDASLPVDLPSALGHAKCPVPPGDYASQWCEINAACSGTPSEVGCEKFAELCGGPTPVVAAGSGGSPATADMQGIAGAATGGSGSLAAVGGHPAASTRPAPQRSGCSTARGPARVTHAWLGFSAIALVFARRRRRPI